MGDISNVTGTEDYAGVEPDVGFEPLVPGWYPVEIEQAEVKDNAKMTGKFLKMRMTVIGDAYAGRKLFTNINLSNPNEVCVRIGMAEMAALKQAVGLLTLADSTELIGKMCEIKVTVSKELNYKGEYDNEVRGYRALDGVATQPQPTPARPAAAPAPRPTAAPVPTAAKRPWER